VLGAGEPVERRPLLGRPQQPQLVGLAVHGDHLLTDVAEHRHRHRPAADVRPRPPLGGDRAAEQQAAVVVGLGPRVGHPGLHRLAAATGQPQPPLDQRPAQIGPHPAGVGPAAEEQAEAGDDHGLAGTGLTGDDGEAAAEGKRGVFDHAQSGDAELLQHSTRQ
jgi:hypothetical protein